MSLWAATVCRCSAFPGVSAGILRKPASESRYSVLLTVTPHAPSPSARPSKAPVALHGMRGGYTTRAEEANASAAAGLRMRYAPQHSARVQSGAALPHSTRSEEHTSELQSF